MRFLPASVQPEKLRRDTKKFPGGYCLEETPDPIPNSAVKLKDANGTAGVTPWESRSLPGL